MHVEDGRPDRHMVAGERLVIPAGAAHAPRIGPDGARVIIIRLHPRIQDETVDETTAN